MCYELFYYVHHLYIVNIALLYVHSENGLAIRYVTGPLAIFVADYLYRAVRSYPLTTSRHARIRYIKFHPCDVVEVGFDRRELLQHTRIGQYVKLCVPELGIFQWHPFTITATPGETKVMADGKPHGIWKIHFKVSGNWTYQLSQRLHRVTAGGDAYANNFDQEARIGRVVDDAVVPEAVPLECRDGECEEGYLMAIADRLDSNDSAVVVNAQEDRSERSRAEAAAGSDARSITPEPHITMIAVTPEMVQNDCEVSSPLDSVRTCRVPMAPKKCESDGSSFMSSSANSMYDDVWFVPELEGVRSQERLPTILVDGPYSAPMETFFEYHANII
ncbi:NADPH oxidase 3, partial [Coemansia guatemalensis]